MNQEASVPPFWPLWKRIAKASPIYPLFLAVQRCRPAAQKRRVIAEMVRQGTLVQAPPTAEETLRILADWEQAGRPAPPPYAHKQNTLRDYGQRFGLSTLVETGTYLGDTVAACKDQFQAVYSIELSADLARLAKERFRADPHVTIFQGDSATVLPKLLATIQEPCLFWLDGHYSGGITALGKSITPILDELQTILTHPTKGHVILIDDARDFRHEKNHPTLEEVREFVASRRPDLSFEVKDDMVRLYPPCGESG